MYLVGFVIAWACILLGITRLQLLSESLLYQHKSSVGVAIEWQGTIHKFIVAKFEVFTTMKLQVWVFGL
jgi:hypothetical protein